MILGFNYIQNLYNEASPKPKMSSVLFRLKANYYVSDLCAKTSSTWTVDVIQLQ